MKVFISWSGERSKETAEALSSWIRQVIQAAETWVSFDIEKGARWNDKINKELEETKVGIICLNKDNLTSEWILFEAGALSKTSDAHVCTFLLDISPADIRPPLGQFQHTLFAKEDVKKLIHTINGKLSTVNEKPLPEKDLDEVFEVFWPRLDVKLNVIKDSVTATTNQIRSDREILEEILDIVRVRNKQSAITDYKSLRNIFSHSLPSNKEYKDVLNDIFITDFPPNYTLNKDEEHYLLYWLLKNWKSKRNDDLNDNKDEDVKD